MYFILDMTDLQVNTKLPLRRNRPGAKAKDWCHWPEETLENMDSLYHIQQVMILKIVSIERCQWNSFVVYSTIHSIRSIEC